MSHWTRFRTDTWLNRSHRVQSICCNTRYRLRHPMPSRFTSCWVRQRESNGARQQLVSTEKMQMRLRTAFAVRFAALFLAFFTVSTFSTRAAETLPSQLSDTEYWKLISDFSEPSGF